MTEPTGSALPGPAASASPAPAPQKRRLPRKLIVVLALLVAVPLAGVALYTWIALSWSYSDGTRAGITQKFSKKGWLCKTWEGELAMTTVPGVAPTIWAFSVNDEAVARQITESVGKQVSLHYKEHRGVPSRCFGETMYFVDAVNVIR